MTIGLHKEPSLKTRLKLFTTATNVLERRRQRVPDVKCDGNCTDHNAVQIGKYVARSCHRCQ